MADISYGNAFEESDLPFKVDVLKGCAVGDAFRRIIKREYVVIQPGAVVASTK